MKGTERKFNKKRILIIAVAVLLLVSAVFAFFHLFSGGVKGTGAPLPQGYSISLTPPTDGSKPESHTALENIGYMVGRLSAREYYHTESKSTAKASIPPITSILPTRKNKEHQAKYTKEDPPFAAFLRECRAFLCCFCPRFSRSCARLRRKSPRIARFCAFFGRARMNFPAAQKLSLCR